MNTYYNSRGWYGNPSLVICALIAVFAAGAPYNVFAQTACDADCADSQSVADQINSELDRGSVQELWAANTSDWFKNQISEPVFEAQTAPYFNLLSLGVNSRVIIQIGPGVDPISNLSFYGRTYKLTMQNGATYFQSLYLIKENRSWKMSGINFVKAP